MTVHDAITRLRAVAARFEEWERPTFADPSGHVAVREIEGMLGISLSTDVRDFFKQSDQITAMSIHNGYTLGGAMWVRRELQNRTFPRDVEVDGKQLEVIPFATDGGGNAFLVGLKEDVVWRWKHETGITVEVAASLVAFLNRIADDWEHFADGDHTWRFLV